MSPTRLCGRCGAIPRACRCPKRQPERRGYSDTAAYRAMRQAVLETYGSDCFYGDGPIDVGDDSPDPLELAHVDPHADGGLFVLENVRPAHRSCNRAAGRRPLNPGGPTDG